MVKKVVLTLNAEKDRLAILSYYQDKTQRNKIPQKLYDDFSEILNNIQAFPYAGKILESNIHRVYTKPPYQIIYRIDDEIITVLHFWDTRRNPADLNLE